MARQIATRLVLALGGLTAVLLIVLLVLLPDLVGDEQGAARVTQALLAVGAAALGAAVLVALLLARSLVRPLEALRARLLALADRPLGPDSIGPPAGSPPEVERVSQALDRLLLALGDQLRERAAERDRLEATLANLADGVVIVDAGRVIRLNAAAERLLGISQSQAELRTVAEVLRDHELVALVEAGRDAPAGRPPAPVFLDWPAPRRFVRGAVTRLQAGTDGGQTLLVLQDLTVLRRLETVRRDFVANVSHDLRTPIAAIRAMVETLQDGALEDPAAARDFLARIDEEIQGMHRLVEQLLELSRLEAGRVELALQPTDAVSVVRSTVNRLAPLAERAAVTLETCLSPSLPLVLADPERLGQVLVSVVHNAIKFTPPGGRIEVSAAAASDGVRLAVSDTGVGLEPEQRERIFERFFKADQARAGGGTGLGLAIAKHTVQLHGGRIWAESPGPGAGTTIHITLPLAPNS